MYSCGSSNWLQNSVLTELSLLAGGIAERVGMCVGDMLLKVNGDDVMTSSVEEVAKLILAGNEAVCFS